MSSINFIYTTKVILQQAMLDSTAFTSLVPRLLCTTVVPRPHPSSINASLGVYTKTSKLPPIQFRACWVFAGRELEHLKEMYFHVLCNYKQCLGHLHTY